MFHMRHGLAMYARELMELATYVAESLEDGSYWGDPESYYPGSGGMFFDDHGDPADWG